MNIKLKNGLNNSSAVRNSKGEINFDVVFRNVDFEERFKSIIEQNDIKCSELDLGILLSDIITHFRNCKSIVKDESYFWKTIDVNIIK